MSTKGAWKDHSDDAGKSPFAGLASLRDALPSGPDPQPKPADRPAARRAPAKAVVRLERKGRGGKAVTVIEQLGLPAEELAAWLKELKAKLGCGGAVEGDTLVLQGDLRKRLRAPLEARGVRKVVGA